MNFHSIEKNVHLENCFKAGDKYSEFRHEQELKLGFNPLYLAIITRTLPAKHGRLQNVCPKITKHYKNY